MAIDAYTGLPRSGKSYSVVKNVILPSLKEGREVHTNIPLTAKLKDAYPGQIHQFPADWFNDTDLCDKFPPGAVVIMDELWRRWPAGLKANNVNFKDKEFLAEHGHNVNEFGHTTRVVLVSQDLSQIAAFARDLVSVTYRSTKLDAVGADSRFRVDIYQGAVTGQNPPKSKLNRTVFDKYEDEYYQWYSSSTKSMTGSVGDESRADKRNNIWKSPFIIFSIAGPLLGIPLLVWYVGGIFFGGMGMGDNLEKPEPEPEPTYQVRLQNPPPPGYEPYPQAIHAAHVPQLPPDPPKVAISTTWQVVGSMVWDQPSGKSKDMIILNSQLTGLRYIPASDCELLPDGIQWQCEVDGHKATPWSGRGEYSNWADGNQLVQRTASVASGATDVRSTTAPVNPPPPSEPPRI